MQRGVILDRDGTLIDFYRDVELGVVTPAFHPEHVRLLPGVVIGLRLLQGAGYTLAIASNQPHAARGQVPVAAIDRVNDTLLERLHEEGIRVATLKRCLHYPALVDGGDAELSVPCACRKPKPGMLEELISELELDRAATWMVGDTAADLGAAHAARVKSALLLRARRCELCVFPTVTLDGLEPTLRASHLDELARLILAA